MAARAKSSTAATTGSGGSYGSPVAVARSQPWTRPSNETSRAKSDPGMVPTGDTIVRSSAPSERTASRRSVMVVWNGADGTVPFGGGATMVGGSSPRNR